MMGIEEINFDEKGLIPAVVQDDNTGEVLMVAYMNREALARTIETGRAWFYSRERKTLWQKGETSGNFQDVKRIMYDCDQDALLLKVEPKGPACHTGHRSCFFRSLAVKEEQVGNMRFRTEADSTGTICQDNHIKILEELVNIIDSRFREMPEGSYVAKLYKEGRERILKKIGEEASEVIIASMSGSKSDTIYETADLIFHLLIALRYDGISLKEIAEELERRRK
ncbi:bifunctional phosphoribosyl-AMP cyclohydrolase/phosphoribosyl-ATP diphosphatase HisIE [Thermoanaerobacterium sp. DL9XJH110]|uniref:bifunctional phosphoribosyl-AMP cyclohydrolase/phosphoribosyl-ATP diphosphatase HisIE n=1 Tax=Thermoanaerobacterium sp. DL9XJH110 TaxID=3386643 RepID=UPI003BB540B2